MSYYHTVHCHNGESCKIFLPLTLVIRVVIVNINSTIIYELYGLSFEVIMIYGIISISF